MAMSQHIEIGDGRIGVGPRFSVSPQRTLRIPEDGQTYPLPPGLGAFPMRRVADFAERLPGHWIADGVFIPMYQREALWLGFGGAEWKPNAVKVGLGTVNAVTGDAWDERLHDAPQDYVVCPDQPWLDGINAGEGRVRQFVATPLGLGDSIEEQLAGTRAGGIRILVFEPKTGIFPDAAPAPTYVDATSSPMPMAAGMEMGLGAGGSLRQKLYPDRFGLDTWEHETPRALVLYVLNSEQFARVTGEPAPPSPVTAEDYNAHGLPWFDLYDEHRGTLASSAALDRARTVGERGQDRQPAIDSEEHSQLPPDDRIRKLRHGAPP